MIIKIFSFFSGIGLLDLGFENEGYSVEFVNELDKAFLNGYKYARSKISMKEPPFGYFNGDINEILISNWRKRVSEFIMETHNQGNIVCFIGGPPCPDFSVGGKNRGRNGEHGKLSSTYIQLICDLKPDLFLFENVKGLWSTKVHKDFYLELRRRIHESGYITTEKLINAIEYCTPQDRNRIMLFGIKQSLANELDLGIGLNCGIMPDGIFNWTKFAKYDIKKVFNYNWPTTSAFIENSFMEPPPEIPQELTVQYWFDKNDVYNHPNSQHFFKPRAGLNRFLTVLEGDDSKKSYKRLHRWRYSPTAAYGNNEVHLHPYKARRLTVAEALAIQSLPKEFILPDQMSLSDMFKSIGNGVPYLASKSIARTIKEFIDNGTKNNGK
jgi:DNA (cytosine-5)-methyltransferase 1